MATEKATATQATSGEVISVRPFQRWLEAIKAEAEVTARFTDRKEVTENIGDSILAAESLDAAIAAQDAGLPSGQNIADIEHVVTDFDICEGEAKYEENSLGVYFRVSAALMSTGEPFQYTVGAPNVLLVLHTARRLGDLPGEFVIRKKASANGDVLLLRRVPPRATKAS